MKMTPEQEAKEVLRRLAETIRHELLSPRLAVENLLTIVVLTANTAIESYYEAKEGKK